MPGRIPFKELRAVFFDADDTLFELNGSLGEIYSSVCRQKGIEIEPKLLDATAYRVWEGFRQEYRNEENGFATSPEREKAVWLKFIRLLFQAVGKGTPSSELAELVYEEFSYPRSRQLRPGVLELVSKLRESDLKVGVLSNNDDRIVRLLERWELAEIFDFIFPTSELGVKKPAIACFEAVQEKVSLGSNQLLYIGDNLELDYHAPRKAGWYSAWYNARGKKVEEDVIQINCHSELMKFL